MPYFMYVFSGLYLCHKSNVGFNYYLHKRFPSITPVVESPIGQDLGDFIFCLFLGIIVGILSWCLRSKYIGEYGITFKDMWNAKVGKKYA